MIFRQRVCWLTCLRTATFAFMNLLGLLFIQSSALIKDQGVSTGAAQCPPLTFCKCGPNACKPTWPVPFLCPWAAHVRCRERCRCLYCERPVAFPLKWKNHQAHGGSAAGRTGGSMRGRRRCLGGCGASRRPCLCDGWRGDRSVFVVQLGLPSLSPRDDVSVNGCVAIYLRVGLNSNGLILTVELRATPLSPC